MHSHISDHLESITTHVLAMIDSDYQKRSDMYILKSKKDIKYTIDFTLESIAVKQKSILINYYQWLIETLAKYQISEKPIFRMFEVLKEVLKEYLSDEDYLFLTTISLEEIQNKVEKSKTISNQLSNHAKEYLTLLLKKDRFGASRFVTDLIENGQSIESIYMDIIQTAMIEVGRKWQYREINVADEHMATVITQYVMTQLYPYIFATKKNGKRLVALALGDELHEIGIRMVADLFEYRGFETHYLGANMPNDAVIQYVSEYKPQLIALSVTISTHLSNLKSLIEAIRADDTLKDIKIMIGGQAVANIPDAVKTFGADGFAFNAIQAVEEGEKLVRD